MARAELLDAIEEEPTESEEPGRERHRPRGHESSPSPAPPSGGAPRVLRWVAGLLFVLAAGAGGTWWYLQAQKYVETDNAFIEGRVVQVSPRVAGHVLKLHVQDNQHVEAGQLLLEIDPRDYQVRVEQAQAAVASARARVQTAQADLDLVRRTAPAMLAQEKSALASAEATLQAAEAEASRAEADRRRYESLFSTGGATQSQLDQFVTAARATRAVQLAAENRVAEVRARLAGADVVHERTAKAEAEQARATADLRQAEAALRQAELELSYTRVIAAQAGTVTKRSVEAGNFVQPGQALLGLVADEKWVLANFKETQLEQMRVGQAVAIHVDAYPQLRLGGRVESIQRGTGARFSLLPAENATGNYVKIVQRVPVKIVFQEPLPADAPLGLGLSVVPRVSIR